ncbi:NTP pyrophosphohydrolases including oxidative damage repair enzymes domain protein, partial [Vibrio parahaemolyticus V-223/04]|jgi:hypothetical protein
MGK